MKKSILNILIYILFPSIIPLFFTNNINSKEYMIYMFISYILLTIYFTTIYKEELINNIKKLNKKNILTTLIYFIAGFILMMLSNYIINYIIIPNGISNNEQGNRELLLNNKLLYGLLLSLIIPYIEEIVFRLSLKKSIKNNTTFILVSSTIFSLLHIVSTTKLIELLYFIPYFILGLTFSTIYTKTNNIYCSTISHILNNTITVLIILLF